MVWYRCKSMTITNYFDCKCCKSQLREAREIISDLLFTILLALAACSVVLLCSDVLALSSFSWPSLITFVFLYVVSSFNVLINNANNTSKKLLRKHYFEIIFINLNCIFFQVQRQRKDEQKLTYWNKMSRLAGNSFLNKKCHVFSHTCTSKLKRKN